MAYGVKYRFLFESVEGVEWTIDILKNGYSGSVLPRALGGSPVLRKDQNDNIWGTSLDMVAECAVDGEFEEFSTSDPFAFQVKVYQGSSLRWQGFMTPEIYNAPEIAPPYDVNVTATDGLGELKQHFFEAQGRKTISALLTYLLGFTGLSLSFRQVTDLSCSAAGAGALLSSVYVNLDYLAGETCYDVLQTLLAAIHSSITQDGNCWLILKETGTGGYNSSNNTVGCFVDGVSSQRSVEHFGGLSTHGNSCWPVGHMTREYIAPKRKMAVISKNHYVPNMLGSWSLESGATDEGDYWNLPSAGDGLSQTINFQQEVGKHLLLSIKVRNVGDGAEVGNLSVYVRLTGSYYQAVPYLYLTTNTGRRRREGNDVKWGAANATCNFEVQAPVESDTDQDYVTIDVLIPLYRNDARSYVRASSLDITVFNGDSLYPKRIYGITLSQYEQTAGFKKIVNIGNGARGEAPDVDLAFACTTDANNYAGLETMLYGVPVTSAGAKITSWSTLQASDLDYLSLMARDYALSCAAARVRQSGVLQTPLSGSAMPFMFVDDHDDVLYIVESFSWDLLNDEISVKMISCPTATLTVSGEETEEGATENPTNHSQAESSGGGGGGGGGGSTVSWGQVSNNKVPLTVDGSAKTVLLDGWTELPSAAAADNGKVLKVVNGVWTKGDAGTVTRVAMTVPTGFSVSGSPITGDGTLEVTLNSQTKNKVLASPSNASGVPSFRALVAADLPDVSGKYVTLDTTQNNISGEKTFTTKPVHIGATSGLDVSEASYIDIGPVRLQYDPNSKALHVTVKSGRSDTIGFYADGFVAAGGAAASGDQIKFVSLTGAQSVDGVKTFLANLVANGMITINGVTLTGSSSKLAVSKNTEFSGISNVTGGKISIQDLLDRIIALENR